MVYPFFSIEKYLLFGTFDLLNFHCLTHSAVSLSIILIFINIIGIMLIIKEPRHNFGETINCGPPMPGAWGWRYNHPLPQLGLPASQTASSPSPRMSPKYSCCPMSLLNCTGQTASSPSSWGHHHPQFSLSPTSLFPWAWVRQHNHHHPRDVIIPDFHPSPHCQNTVVTRVTLNRY